MAYPPNNPAIIAALKALQDKARKPVVKRNNGNRRPDGTLKGKGFFGEIKRPDGSISTELSITSGDVVPGKETLIPTMVPSLTNAEVAHLLSGKYNPAARQGVDDIISRKAIDFARQRAAEKKPFFALPEEEAQFKPAPAPVPAPINPMMAKLQLMNLNRPNPQPVVLPLMQKP